MSTWSIKYKCHYICCILELPRTPANAFLPAEGYTHGFPPIWTRLHMVFLSFCLPACLPFLLGVFNTLQ